jgi:hypothetical protein
MAPRTTTTLSLSEIQRAIARLAPRDFATLLGWLEDYRAQAWDHSAEAERDAVHIDALLAEVLGEPGESSLQSA